MKKFLLPADKTAFKANLHCHTTFSDGKNTVEEIKKLYMERGYSVVAFSDHNCLVPHPELAGPDFVPLTATEINIDDGRGHTYHSTTTTDGRISLRRITSDCAGCGASRCSIPAVK